MVRRDRPAGVGGQRPSFRVDRMDTRACQWETIDGHGAGDRDGLARQRGYRLDQRARSFGAKATSDVATREAQGKRWPRRETDEDAIADRHGAVESGDTPEAERIARRGVQAELAQPPQAEKPKAGKRPGKADMQRNPVASMTHPPYARGLSEYHMSRPAGPVPMRSLKFLFVSNSRALDHWKRPVRSDGVRGASGFHSQRRPCRTSH